MTSRKVVLAITLPLLLGGLLLTSGEETGGVPEEDLTVTLLQQKLVIRPVPTVGRLNITSLSVDNETAWRLSSLAGCPEPYTGSSGCHGLPRVRPTGRMVLVDVDPAQAAAFYEEHLGARRLEAGKVGPPWSSPGCAQVLHLQLPWHNNQTVTLVRDEVKPNPLRPRMPIEAAIANMEVQLERVMASTDTDRWTPWMNNHDGYGTPLWTLGNATAIFEKLWQCYGGVLRGYVPRSFLTYEVNGDDDLYYKEFIFPQCSAGEDGPDTCRNYTVDKMYNDQGLRAHGWFKATTATADPLAAAKFADRYLGGVHVPSPYPFQGDTACHYAEWVLFPPTASERPFWLHFVWSSAGPGSLSADQFARMCARGRNLSAGVFDTLLYDAIRFDVEDLAPFLQRLQADSVPLLVRRTSAHGGSVFTAIPGSSFAFELRAGRGLPAEGAREERWDMCSPL